VKECGFQEISYLFYNPDLTPNDYYIFAKIRFTKEEISLTDEEFQAIEVYFETKDKNYLFKDTEVLPKRCTK